MENMTITLPPTDPGFSIAAGFTMPLPLDGMNKLLNACIKSYGEDAKLITPPGSRWVWLAKKDAATEGQAEAEPQATALEVGEAPQPPDTPERKMELAKRRWFEARAAFLREIRQIDVSTPWADPVPEWWSGMMELERAAIESLPDFDTGKELPGQPRITLMTALLGDVQAARLTAEKTHTVAKRDGFRVSGFVMQHADGRRAIIECSAVRWLGLESFSNLMHTDNPTTTL